MNNINEKLIKAYKANWSSLTEELNKILQNKDYDQKPTNPLLLSIDEEKYTNADINVLIIGQETNDWGHIFNSNFDETIEIYDDFFNSGHALENYGGQFWNGVNRFHDLLAKKFPDKKINLTWNNVVKIGAAGRNQNHPKEYIYNIEKNNFNVLPDEIEILNPDIILFVSGPYYDSNIEDKLKDIEFVKVDDEFPIRRLSKIKYRQYQNIFRTYHPNYLWRNNINDYFNTIIENIHI